MIPPTAWPSRYLGLVRNLDHSPLVVGAAYMEVNANRDTVLPTLYSRCACWEAAVCHELAISVSFRDKDFS